MALSRHHFTGRTASLHALATIDHESFHTDPDLPDADHRHTIFHGMMS